MEEVVTTRGLAELVKLKKAGKPLPKNAPKLVKMYINFKRRYVKQREAELRAAVQQLKFAEAAAKELGIDV